MKELINISSNCTDWLIVAMRQVEECAHGKG
jgi:hypothetical protein